MVMVVMTTSLLSVQFGQTDTADGSQSHADGNVGLLEIFSHACQKKHFKACKKNSQLKHTDTEDCVDEMAFQYIL